jgi:hypothetical protein
MLGTGVNHEEQRIEAARMPPYTPEAAAPGFGPGSPPGDRTSEAITALAGRCRSDEGLL